jgi:hypothetical protein
MYLLIPCVVELQNYLSTNISACSLSSTELTKCTLQLQTDFKLIRKHFHTVERLVENSMCSIVEAVQMEFDGVGTHIRQVIEEIFAEVEGPVVGQGWWSSIRKLWQGVNSSKGKSETDVAEKVEKVHREVSRLLQDEFKRA